MIDLIRSHYVIKIRKTKAVSKIIFEFGAGKEIYGMMISVKCATHILFV